MSSMNIIKSWVNRRAVSAYLADSDPYSLVPPLPPGVKNLRNRELFSEHRLTETFVSEHGQTLPVQFHGYNGDSTGIICLADVAEVTKYLAGTGYLPMRVSDRYAIVNLLFNDYKDSSSGPYRAILVNIFATRSGQTLDWRDATSAMLPLFDPNVALIIGPYAMSPNTGARDIGRGLMGLNKLETDARITHDATGTQASIINGFKTLVLSAKVNDPTARELAFAGTALLLNLFRGGFPNFIRAMSRPVQHAFVGYDPASGLPLAASKSFTVTRPTFKLWSAADRLDLQPGIHVSDLLLRFKVEPILTTRDQEMSVALEPERIVPLLPAPFARG